VTLVVVGGGLAGAKAAAGARAAGYDGRVVIVGDEPHRPYDRPPLSKQVLRGEASPESAGVDVDESVEVLTGTPAVSLDVARRCVARRRDRVGVRRGGAGHRRGAAPPPGAGRGA
jgi:NADPH-dependent 2,4-dienoyl-CoA reductase/sulfur reductase-like enzyme